MALAARRAMSVTYGFRDQEQTESNMLIHMANPLYAVIDWPAFVQSVNFGRVGMANVVTQLSEADLCYVGLRLSERETDMGETGTGEAEKKGVFLFTDEAGQPSFRMAIPGIKESLLQGDGRNIDLTDAAVAAYIAAFQTAGAGQPVTPNGVQIRVPFAAYKQHRRSNTSTRRRTG